MNSLHEKSNAAYQELKQHPFKSITVNVLLVFVISMLLLWNLFPIELSLAISAIASILAGTGMYVVFLVIYKLMAETTKSSE